MTILRHGPWLRTPSERVADLTLNATRGPPAGPVPRARNGRDLICVGLLLNSRQKRIADRYWAEHHAVLKIFAQQNRATLSLCGRHDGGIAPTCAVTELNFPRSIEDRGIDRLRFPRHQRLHVIPSIVGTKAWLPAAPPGEPWTFCEALRAFRTAVV